MSFLSNLLPKVEGVLFPLLILLLPTQLGKHFWPDFSIVSGIRVDYLSPTLYVTDILIVLLFLTWLIRKVQSANFKMQFSGFKIFSAFVLFLLFNIFATHSPWNGLYHVWKFLEGSFVAFYVATTVRNISQVKNIVVLLGVGVIGESLLAIGQFLKQGSVGGILYFLGERTFTASTPGIANASLHGELILRAYGTFSHPNVLAGFLLVSMICMLFSLPWWQKKVEKTLWAVTILFGTSALLLTMSRIAIVLWIFVLILVLIGTSIRKQVSNATLAIGTLLFAVIILLSPLGARFLQTNAGEEAFVMRESLIRAGSELFIQQPSVGEGFGNFIPSLAVVEKPLSMSLYLQPVHNIFLLVLVETGIIGFTFFVWFVVNTYQKLFTDIRIKTQKLPYRIFLIALSAMIVLGLFDHYPLTLQQGQLLFGVLIGLSWTTLRN